MTNKSKISGFRDLEVYQTLFSLMTVVMTKVIPRLPANEKFDLCDQMSRACKAPTALLAEGFAKRFQKKQWSKYLDDCIGECNEMMNHLATAMAVYGHLFKDKKSLQILIDKYDKCSRQLTSLKKSWTDYHNKNKNKN